MTPSPSSVSPQGGHRWGLLGIFFVLALTLSAVAYFFLSEKYATEPIIPSYTPRDTAADWQTYTNPQFGIEFKYPNGWRVEAPGNTTIQLFNYPADKYMGSGNFELGDSKMEVSRTLKTSVPEGHTAVQFGPNEGYETVTNDFGQVWLVLLKKSENTYQQISFYGDYSAQKSVYTQILSTFKFTTPVDMSTWKTYTNAQYGFSIQMPATWKDYVVYTKASPDATATSIIQVAYNKTAQLPNQSFSIIIYTPAQWSAHQQRDIPHNILLSQNQSYVFARPFRFETLGLPGESDISQILSTFKFTK